MLQNSTTYVSYPSNKNSRFIHSIGVCSVAGDLLTSSFSHARAADLRKYLQEFSDFLDEHLLNPGIRLDSDAYRDRIIGGWKQSIQGHSKFTYTPHLEGYAEGEPHPINDSYGEFESGFLIDTLWQCVRLCLLYTSPSPRDQRGSRMPSSA